MKCYQMEGFPTLCAICRLHASSRFLSLKLYCFIWLFRFLYSIRLRWIAEKKTSNDGDRYDADAALRPEIRRLLALHSSGYRRTLLGSRPIIRGEVLLFFLTSRAVSGITAAVLRSSQNTNCLSTTQITVYHDDEKFEPHPAFLIRAD